jgi:carbonic anhydrase
MPLHTCITFKILTASTIVVGPLIFRNVCGHVAPILNDLVALDSLLYFKDVIIVHHTGASRLRCLLFTRRLTKFSRIDCGSLMIKDENVRTFIKKELPGVKNVDSLKFGGIIE